MPKFNRPIAIRVPTPDRLTHQGGFGFSRTDAKEELFLLGVSNTVGENTFYESADVRDKRFKDLVHAVTAEDPEWVRQFASWLRTSGFMRSASVIIAAEYIKAGGPNGRQVVSAVLQRPDEPAELLSYWISNYGRKIPMPIKRGVADALGRLYNERNLLRYDGQNNAMRFGDVIELVHPRPSDSTQSVLFRYAIDRRHNRDRIEVTGLNIVQEDIALMALPESERRANLDRAINAGWSWERLAGWLPGGMDKAAWEAVIPNMGLMALTRNLRNFDERGVSNEIARTIEAKFRDRDEVRKSRQFPLRFLSAWKNVSSLRWGPALEDAIELSIDNIPARPGRTLILIDVSGSMEDVAISARGPRGRRSNSESPLRWEAAAVFGVSLAKRCDAADVFTFNTNTRPVAVSPADSVLRKADEIRRHVGGGTDTLGAILNTYQKGTHDRVVILTDEQTGYGWNYRNGRDSWTEAQASIKVPVITFNLAGYDVGHTPEYQNWRTIGGLSDASFQLLPALERRSGDRWPWQVD